MNAVTKHNVFLLRLSQISVYIFSDGISKKKKSSHGLNVTIHLYEVDSIKESNIR